jgi:hypothetical protein
MKKQTQTPAPVPDSKGLQDKHTQGEWEVEYCLDGSTFITSGERIIAMIQSDNDEGVTPEDDANAELICKSVNNYQSLVDALVKVNEQINLHIKHQDLGIGWLETAKETIQTALNNLSK